MRIMQHMLCWRASLAIAVALGGCHRAPSPDAATLQAPPVTVAHPRIGPADEGIALTGTVAASATVDLIAQVSGTIRARGFADGSFVRRGQMLFRIDPDTYAAQLDAARARELQAQGDYERQRQLLGDDATSRANVDAARSTLRQASANRRVSQIAVRDTIVRAPFSGWIGTATVDVGAFVGAGTVRLATVQRIDPVFVDFSIGERQLLALRGGGKGWQRRGRTVAVGRVDQRDYPYRGTLDFAQQGIDAATGTQGVRAVVRNGGGSLLPGMAARVRIAAPAAPPAMLLPEAAIQSDPLGDYVLVVDGRRHVQRRDVALGAQQGDQRVITSGVSPRDWVVVDGLANLRIGQPASVHTTVLAPAAK